ncbi:MAG: neutral/alkaline non-lysosomal ceramidase N-terminal domain-containing protein [Candidatus Hodarchaeota archaeon]
MKVAFGKTIITPPEKLGGYLGKTLAGYTPIPKCTGKLDDVHARAVLIEDEILGGVKKRLILIAVDALKLPFVFTSYIKEKIQEKYYIHPDQILIHATHTHKGPASLGSDEFMKPGGYPAIIWGIAFSSYRGDDRYKVWVALKIRDMIGEMLENLQPAKIAWTKKLIEEDVIINRRNPLKRSKSNMSIISFKHAETGKLIGFVENFAMHPTTLANFTSKLSADYPGRLVHRVDELTDGEVAAIHITAPAGDLNPITTCGTDFEALEKNRQPVYGQKGLYKDTTRLGYFLGEKALEIANSIPDADYFDKFEYESYVRLFWVPMHDFKEYWSKSWPLNRVYHIVKKYALLKIALMLADKDEEPNFPGFALKNRGNDVKVYSIIQHIKIKVSKGKKEKRLSITGVPGELFEEFANRIYENTPTGPDDTFIFQNANDWIAYLFPLKEYIKGGYEGLPSFSAFCGAYVMNNYFELLEDIEAGITGGHN